MGSPAATCRSRRRVTVNKARVDRDLAVGRDRTGGRGTWRVRHKRGGAGKYYAVVSRTIQCRDGYLTVCGTDTSGKVRAGR